MSRWQRWIRSPIRRRWLSPPRESDVASDPAMARSRPTGGKRGLDTGDSASTTGPGANGVFVGRVCGEDCGFIGWTGAEARRPHHRSHG